MTTLTEGRHAGGFITWEAARDYTREVVTIATGGANPVFEPGHRDPLNQFILKGGQNGHDGYF